MSRSPRPLIWGLLCIAVLGGVAWLAQGIPDATSSAAPAEVWGEPCSPYHPPACYAGSNESTAADATVPVSPLIEVLAVGDLAPAAVELLCFDAVGGDQVVNIEWQTATEFDTWGFYLLRSESPSESPTPISDFIPHCDEGGMLGGYYEFQDFSVVSGKTYYYRLQEKVSDTESVYYPSLNEPPLSAIPGLPTPTPTATRTPTRTSTPTSTPTVTPSATPTASPTQAAPTSTPGLSSVPTSTPLPTVIQDGSTEPTRPLGSTFTPSPTSAPAMDTPMPTTMYRVTGMPDDDVSVIAALSGSGTSTETVADTADQSATYLVPPDADLSPETGYPVGLAVPAPTALPDGYAPLPNQRSPQLATMTPEWSYPLPGHGAGGQGDTRARLSLYCGFGVSVLLLLLGLMVILRPKKRKE